MNASATIEIARTPADVFAWVNDVSHDPSWRTGVVESGMLTDGPLAVGSRGFARAGSADKPIEAVWEVVEYDPAGVARWQFVSGPLVGTGGYVCEPIEAGTRFTLEADVRPMGWMRVLGPLFGMIGRRQNGRDVATLKSILEQGEPV